MFPQSREAWRLLNGGVFVLALGVFGSMVLADPESGTIFLAVVGVCISVLFLFRARWSREREEAVESERAKRAAADPVGVAEDDLARDSAGLLRWTTGLGAFAFLVAVVDGVGACSGDAKEARHAFLASLVYFALAAAAWLVRNKVSRVASLVLFTIPALGVLGSLIGLARHHILSRDALPALLVPVLLAAAALKCCIRTFQLHRRAKGDR
jgi:uncharacterized membrane protein YfcA